MGIRSLLATILAASSLVLSVPGDSRGAPVRVGFVEGAAHTFLVLRDGNAKAIAHGEWWQVAAGERLEVHLRFRFADGSLSHETFVLNQRRVFTLASYRLVQRGPSFPRDVDATIERPSGRYTITHRKRGDVQDIVDSGRLDLPDDVYGGSMLPLLVRNFEPTVAFSVHVVVFTPKPRVVRVDVKRAEDEKFMLGPAERTARRYVAHPELRGLTRVLASLTGKTPPDLHIWMAGEAVPSFVRFEGPLYPGGPVWRIDSAGPRWK